MNCNTQNEKIELLTEEWLIICIDVGSEITLPGCSITARSNCTERLLALRMMRKALHSWNEALNNIFHLMKTKGIRQVDLANYFGISRNAITQWKTKQTKPYMNYIDQLAAYFDVSINDLLHPKKSNLYESFLSDEDR